MISGSRYSLLLSQASSQELIGLGKTNLGFVFTAFLASRYGDGWCAKFVRLGLGTLHRLS